MACSQKSVIEGCQKILSGGGDVKNMGQRRVPEDGIGESVVVFLGDFFVEVNW